MWGIFLDIVVCGLLAATVVHAVLLNRRLKHMQSIQADFEAIVHDLNQATGRAESGVYALKAAATELAAKLQRDIDTGQKLQVELSYMVKSGDDIANRLSQNISSARPVNQAAQTAKPAPVSAPKPAAAAPKPAAKTAVSPSPLGVGAVESPRDEEMQSLAERLKALR
jgi:hypothetical protein